MIGQEQTYDSDGACSLADANQLHSFCLHWVLSISLSCSEADNGASLEINMTTVSLFGEGEESDVERRTEIRALVNCTVVS